MSRILKFDAPIEDGGDTTPFVNMDGATLVGMYAPAALDGANYTFLTKHQSGDTPVAVTGVSLTHVNGAYLPLSADQYTKLLGCAFIAVKSDATETADRIIKLIYRELVK